MPRLFLPLLLLLLAACDSGPPKLAKLPAGGVVLAFGDSLTHGTGARAEESYPAVLQGLIGRRVMRAGVPGEVTAEGLARLPGVLREANSDLLILIHGGNDLLRRTPQERIAANLRAMVQLPRERGRRHSADRGARPGPDPGPQRPGSTKSWPRNSRSPTTARPCPPSSSSPTSRATPSTPTPKATANSPKPWRHCCGRAARFSGGAKLNRPAARPGHAPTRSGTAWPRFSSAVIIPTVIDQNPCAHLRMPRDMIFHGWSMRLFQAWQHSATMSS